MTDQVTIPRPSRHPAIPPHVKTAEEIAEDVSVALSNKPDGSRRLVISIDNVQFTESANIDRLLNLVSLTKQVKHRTAEDRAQRRRYNTGAVKGYYGIDVGAVNTPFGVANLTIKLEAQAWLPRPE